MLQKDSVDLRFSRTDTTLGESLTPLSCRSDIYDWAVRGPEVADRQLFQKVRFERTFDPPQNNTK